MRLFQAEQSHKELQEIHNLISKSRILLEQSRKQSAEEMSTLQSQFSEKQKEYENTLTSLRLEVDNLELRKKEALKPLTEKERVLSEKEVELVSKQKTLDTEIARYHRLQNDLGTQLDAIEHRLAEIGIREVTISKKEDEIASGLAYLKKQQEAYIKKESMLQERETLLEAKRVALIAQEKRIEAENQAEINYIKEQKQQITNDRIKLEADQNNFKTTYRQWQISMQTAQNQG